MTEDQITDRMAQMIRVGFVNARQPEKMRVKVTIPDTTGAELITDFLPVLCPRASQDMQYDLPDVGDQVLCLFLPYGLEQGFVVGAMYGRQVPPVQSGDKFHRKFKDGAIIEYDRASHALNAVIPGTVTVKCEGPITLEAPIVYVRGTFVNTAKDGSPGKSVFSGGMEVQDGGVNVPDADVVASGVSLTSHTTEGVQPGEGQSANPTGGSAASPGTTTIPVGAMSAGALAASLESKTDILEKDVNSRGTEIEKLILCMPQIAAAMAEKAQKNGNFLEERGWRYLYRMFQAWFADITGNTNTWDEPIWIEWNWAINFLRTKIAYNIFTNHDLQEGTIYSYRALKKLGDIIKKKNLFDTSEKNITFNFIDASDETWRDWETLYNTLIPVRWDGNDFINPNGLYIAMGDFSLRALTSGTADNMGNGKWRINLTRVGVFIHDIFNFSDWGIVPDLLEQFIPQLGFWRCEPPDGAKIKGGSGYRGLNNLDFKKFSQKYGRGHDLLVLSKPHIVENLKAVSYVYSC